MSGVRLYPTAEIIIYRPSAINNYEWCWSVYLPDKQGQPELTHGYGRDYEDAWQKASRARDYIQKHGV